jgi:hypothetical protein
VGTKLGGSGTGKRTSSVPLDDILATVQRLIPDVHREDHGFSFRGRLGTTHLHVRPVYHKAKDGSRITDVVTITTDVTEFPIPAVGTEANLAALNMSAVLSALLLVRRGETPVLVSRLSAFEGDDEAWNLYTPILAFAAVYQSEVFVQTILRADPSRAADDDSEVVPEAHAASPWGAREFDLAQDLLERIGILANSDATGLTAEFPWDKGAVSHMEGFLGGPLKRTSLLRFTTTERHPALGNGLLCRLTLPVSYREDQLARAACRLNVLELVAIDAPPFLGAWTVDPETQSLTFVTFWANLLHRPGVVANLTTWMMARSQIAKRWTEVDATLCALAREGNHQPGEVRST